MIIDLERADYITGRLKSKPEKTVYAGKFFTKTGNKMQTKYMHTLQDLKLMQTHCF